MQTDIANGCGDVLGGRKRASQHRLVDVAEADILLREGGQSFRIVPARVAHLHHPRIFDELPQQAIEIFTVERSVLE